MRIFFSKLTELLWLLENPLSQNDSKGHRAHKNCPFCYFQFLVSSARKTMSWYSVNDNVTCHKAEGGYHPGKAARWGEIRPPAGLILETAAT